MIIAEYTEPVVSHATRERTEPFMSHATRERTEPFMSHATRERTEPFMSHATRERTEPVVLHGIFMYASISHQKAQKAPSPITLCAYTYAWMKHSTYHLIYACK